MFNFVRDHRGGVTVFITLIMVPSVMFIGLFIDLATFRMTTPISAMKVAGESILSNYNGLLKDTYGLFALSSPGADTVNGAMTCNPVSDRGIFANNTLDGTGYFFPGASAKSDAIRIPNDQDMYFTLANNAILETQISDYMKYRAAASFFSGGEDGESSPTEELLGAMDKVDEDAKAINKKADLDTKVAELDRLYQDMYDAMVMNDSFDKGVIEATIGQIRGYDTELTEALDKIVELEDDINDWQIEAAKQAAKPPKYDADGNEIPPEPDYDEMISDAEDELDSLGDTVKYAAEQLGDCVTSIEGNMKVYADNIDLMGSIAVKIDAKVLEIRALMNEVKTLANNASEDLKSTFIEEIEKDYEPMFAVSFTEVAEKLKPNIGLLDNVVAHFEAFSYDSKLLTDLAGSAGSIKSDHGNTYNAPGFVGQWKTVERTSPEQFKLLKKWYGADAQADSDEKKKAKKDQTAAKDALGEQQKKADNDGKAEIKGAKKIPDSLYKMLYGRKGSSEDYKSINQTDGVKLAKEKTDSITASGSTGSLLEQFLKGTGDLVIEGLNRVLFVEYDLGMFSCATTGKVPGKESIVEESLTGVPKAPDFNYLYSTELEYIMAGCQDAWANRLAAQGTLGAMLYVRDFTASCSKKNPINGEIKRLAFLLGNGNPVKQKLWDFGLRSIVTGLESGDDVYRLLQGEKISLMKSEANWKYSLESAADGKELKETGMQISYEMYLRVMLLMFVPEPALAGRTTDLISLNLTNYKAGGPDSMPDSLHFMAGQAYTAVEIWGVQTPHFIFPTLAMFGLENPMEGNFYRTNYRIGY